MVNHYEDNGYANESYVVSEQERSYKNNDYKGEYLSYKPAYNQEYKLYENNDYKSKEKEQNILNISIINCNTVNYNFNRVAIGNLSIVTVS